MDPITIKMRVLGGAKSSEGWTEAFVDDPTETVRALKQRLFGSEISEGRSIRWIFSGRTLDDTQQLSQCGLGESPHVHVVIGEKTNKRESSTLFDRMADRKLLCMMALMSLSGIALHFTWKRRSIFSKFGSQVLFIVIAVWTYILLCHFFPLLGRALVGGSAAKASNSEAGSHDHSS
eukprot:gnl/MRDRNA2_/MRDRNA2_54366_c1_seq1.p1 gnl/MRDRNA2_/MRDRNA2_54366_c1~~gnl/MRDRNA2_/MRDRNA2_54366_c1_seq1.p1  ORF type:complete len:194 (-),score=12.17 gnl/MRDRNA2_/MRDRNA2_54366_c1_seq1:76-606(-)